MSLIASYDLLGNSNPTVGTITGTENNITYGPAATFNGIDSSINFGNNFNFGNRGFTIKCNVKVQPGSMRSTIFSKYLFTATCTESGFNVDVLDTGQIRFVVEGNCNNYIYSDSTVSIGDGQFHELIVYRTFGNNIFILIDGVDRTGSRLGPGGVTNMNNSVNFVIGHPSSSAYLAYASSLNGEIKNVEIYDSPYNSDITSDLISWYSFDTNFRDGYGTNHATGTNTGLVYGKKGNSAYFNGANSMVTIPGSASISEAYLNVSVSYWVKFRSTANGWIFMKSFGGGAGGDYFTSVLGQKIRAATLGGTGSVLALNTFVLDQWYHVVLVYRSGISLQLYIDNQLQGTDTSPGNISANSDPLTIGDNPYFTNYRLEGFIDMFGIFNRALGLDEISTLYNNGLGYDPFSSFVADPINADKLAHWKLNGNSLDEVGANNGSEVSISYVLGRENYAASFATANSSVINIPTITLARFVSYSFAFWIYIDPSISNYAGVFTNNNTGYGVFYNPFNKTIYWNGSTGCAPNAVPFGKWVHVAFNNTAGTGQFYINGQSSGSTVSVSGDIYMMTLGFSNATYPFKGRMDDVRVYNRILTTTEIKSLSQFKSFNFFLYT